MRIEERVGEEGREGMGREGEADMIDEFWMILNFHVVSR